MFNEQNSVENYVRGKTTTDGETHDRELDTISRALEMCQAGAGSLGYVAEQVGLSKRDLIREARVRGIKPPFDEQTVYEELGV